MAPKPTRKRAPDVLPDSLPPQGEPDVLPDSLGREPAMPPDSLPPRQPDNDDTVDGAQ